MARERKYGRLRYLARRAELKGARDALKLEVLVHYGGDPPRCARCGYSDVRALQLDHVDGGGSAERRRTGYASGSGWYTMLKRRGFPPGLVVLCANCNWVKRAENGEVRGVAPLKS